MARTTVQLRRRSLKFYALHTGESLTTTYWENGRYIPDELERVNYVLRDFRANEVKPIDPTLLDLLTRIQLSARHQRAVPGDFRIPLARDQRDAPCEQRRRRGAQPAHQTARRSTSASRVAASRNSAAPHWRSNQAASATTPRATSSTSTPAASASGKFCFLCRSPSPACVILRRERATGRKDLGQLRAREAGSGF